MLVPQTHPMSSPSHLSLKPTPCRPTGAEPLEVVRHFLQRCGPQALMRRYRLPAFDGAEGFLQVLASEVSMYLHLIMIIISSIMII